MRAYTFLLFLSALAAQAADDFPIVADDLEVTLFAREPMVRNPCAITFDTSGRLCVGMGPQYRNPTPETPGDSVFILIDSDGDGRADQRKLFATGLNAIQGLAWKGDRLYIANAPDLTVARDLDGDDEADEYLRLYTDLGNLEHGLHGLSFGPDGKLYMSKGNSKGLSSPPDRIAPAAFRELWGVTLPEGTPDFPQPVETDKGGYQKNYHDPRDDWGLNGGVLRCAPNGENLEIISRGFRNPWDIAYDDGFDWLGTDNDQTQGDKFFSPFYAANFGWGHPWSYAWKGDDHLPSAPSSGPLFEGSGTGVTFYSVPGYPEKYRGVFLVNDWLRREVYIYRPEWQGALLRPDRDQLEIFAHADGGRAMQKSGGRSFDPVDIEIGPDGGVYISSWGRQYGLELRDGEMVNEGRIYRIKPKRFEPAQRDRLPSIGSRTQTQLIAGLGSPLPARRSEAQDELLRRGKPFAIPQGSKQQETWGLWTLGRMGPLPDVTNGSPNAQIQSLRILAHHREPSDAALASATAALADLSPRIRHQAVLTLHQLGATSSAELLLELSATETDRIVFYSCWQALRTLMPTENLKATLSDPRAGARRAALLALLEDDALSQQRLEIAAQDPDKIVATLASKRLGGKAQAVIRGGSITPKTVAAPTSTFRPLTVVTAIQPITTRRYETAVLRLGATAYTDRTYTFSALPKELIGETFIRSANDDADPSSGTGVTLELPYPSTIYLADDQRGSQLPRWARGQFEQTELRLDAGDTRYRLHRAQFPAGRMSFGANRDGVAARKANYILIVVPSLLDPPGEPTNLASTLTLVENANTEHGRSLFLHKNGATCMLCHQLEGRGNVFAPDLSDIGSRADAETILRSILEPSAEITEGFAMQNITKHDGLTVGGIILEETGRSLKISPAAGVIVEVAKSDIAERTGSKLSTMPAGFGAMLRPQDLAAITRYLLSLKGTKQGFALEQREDVLEIQLAGTTIATYTTQHPQIRRPFFANLKTPGGTQITRNFPPRPGDPGDHWDMHPGLSLGFANLNGVNFWHNRDGSVVHQKFSELKADKSSARFTVHNLYLDAAGETLCREVASFHFATNADGYLMTYDTRISSDRPLAFGVKEEMGLALRAATPITVKHGRGQILSAAGGRNENGTWGEIDQWWDYFGPIGTTSAGAHIMSAPSNRPVWSHSRDYGVLVANPFPVDNPANRGKSVAVPAGETLWLRFGIQIHEHTERTDYDPEKAYSRFLKTQ